MLWLYHQKSFKKLYNFYLTEKDAYICHALDVLYMPCSSQVVYPKILSTSPVFKMPLQVKFKFCVRLCTFFFYVSEVFVCC